VLIWFQKHKTLLQSTTHTVYCVCGSDGEPERERERGCEQVIEQMFLCFVQAASPFFK